MLQSLHSCIKSLRFDIAGQALIQLDQTKWNAEQLLPFIQDIQKLHCHLAVKQKQHLKDLQEHPSFTNWKELAKVTLFQVVLFNRRRAGEVSRMHCLHTYRRTHQKNREMSTWPSQHLNRSSVGILYRKRGRKVPILLIPSMRESLDALTESREE